VVVVLAEVIILILSGVEEQFTSEHFEGHASEGPHVGAKVVIGARQDLGTSVLPSLNLSCEVVVLPAGIPKISNFYFKSFL
jgi:hypothetical protein